MDNSLITLKANSWGESFNDSDVEETIETTSTGQLHVHKKITLPSGIVLFEDYYKDPEPEKKQPDFSKISKSNTAFDHAPTTQRKVDIFASVDAQLPSSTPRVESKDIKTKTRPKSSKDASKSKNNKSSSSAKKTGTKDGLKNNKTKKPSEEPKPITVYPSESVQNHSKEDIGVWTFPTNSQKEDTADWVPHEVLLHPVGTDVIDVTDAIDAIDDSSLHGVWTPDAEGGPVKVYPPEVGKLDLQDSSKKCGVWTLPGKLDIKWPPTKDNITIKKQRTVGKVGASRCKPFSSENDREPRSMSVYTKKMVPKAKITDDSIGVWSFPSKSTDGNDDSRWEKQEITVYPPGSHPPVMDDSRPHGVWRYPNTNSGVGKLRPHDLEIFVPGATPPLTPERTGGVWAYPSNKLNVTWPPKEAKKAVQKRSVGRLPSSRGQLFEGKDVQLPRTIHVHTKASASATPKGKDPIGVWNFGSMIVDDSNWQTHEVLVYPPGITPSEGLDGSRPHGVWSYQEDSSTDVHVYPPGMGPPAEHDKPSGVWSSLPGKLAFTWPPTAPPPVKSSRKKPGKLKTWQFPKESNAHTSLSPVKRK